MVACVVCSVQKRGCPGRNVCLGQYFVGDKRSFLQVKQVFGFGNVKAWIEEAPENQRPEVARCIKFEASKRIQDPVGGVTKLHDDMKELLDDMKERFVIETINNSMYKAEIAKLDKYCAKLNKEYAELKEDFASCSLKYQGDSKLKNLVERSVQDAVGEDDVGHDDVGHDDVGHDDEGHDDEGHDDESHDDQDDA